MSGSTVSCGRENQLSDNTAEYQTYDTPVGKVTVYLKDEPGPKGHKKGTTKMEYKDPPPRPMKLKRKYRQSS